MKNLDLKQNIIRRRQWVRRVFIVLLSAIIISSLAVIGISAYVGWSLTHPQKEAIDTTPSSVELNYLDISFKSRTDNLTLKGWLCKSSKNLKTVIFAHGYGRNRLQSDVPSLPIAKELVNNGYNVLLFDFRNSGESEGKLTSIGEFEIQDLLGACDFVKSQHQISKNIVLFGFSMGASTAIVAASNEESVLAVIADSPFCDLESYLIKNLPVWSKLPAIPFTSVIMFQTPILTGINMSNVSPIEAVKKFNNKPLLLIHSFDDNKVPFENSIQIKNAYNNAKLYKTYNAKHVKSYSVSSDNYIKEVLEFLQ